MNSNRLTQYINGYVDIVVEGYYIERFINICSTKKILLWNLKRDDSITLYASIAIKDFKKLKEISKKTKCKVRIKKKKGMPFTIRKYKKRQIFVIFFLLIIIGIIILSNFVWNIDIKGNENISKEEILTLAEEYGLSIGKLKGKVDTKDIINKIRLERDDIAWVGIEIEGTNAIIEIVEADIKPEIIDEDEYCNIVASKDAMITKITARNGTPLVKHGDIVKKGDILVAGYLEGKYTGKQYVHSQGEVQAKVWYSATEKVELKEIKKVETGVSQNKYSVKINNFEINFNKTLPKFEKYDTIEAEKKLKLFSNFYLPFELITHTYKEYTEETIIHSIEEAKQIGTENAIKKLEEEVKEKVILDKQVKVKQEADYILVEVTLEVEENIGIEEKIVF